MSKIYEFEMKKYINFNLKKILKHKIGFYISKNFINKKLLISDEKSINQ